MFLIFSRKRLFFLLKLTADKYLIIKKNFFIFELERTPLKVFFELF